MIKVWVLVPYFFTIWIKDFLSNEEANSYNSKISLNKLDL